MDRLTTIKAAACTAAAALTAFWGWTGWLAAAWFLAMLLDYATGSAAALRAGTWSSRAAREGLWHKAGSVAGVLVAALLDFALRVLLGSVPGLGIDYDVLLCDEPFKGLDQATKALVMDYFLGKTKGKTVILVTHDQGETEALGGHFLLL